MESLMKSVWCNVKTTIIGLFIVFIIFGSELPVSGLQCIICGEFNDGVGSITPCIDYTVQSNLKDCPANKNQHCVKYVNEGSVVRECANDCSEKRSESWGTSIYCCTEEGCNSSSSLYVSMATVFTLSIIAIFNRLNLSY